MSDPSPEPKSPPAGHGQAGASRPPRPLLHLLQGLLMGTADVVPGVSGGTVALVVGIYERLIEAIRAVTAVPVSVLRRGLRAGFEAFREIEWRFIIPLGIGILSAFVLGARLIPPLMAEYPEESRALFFGLVAASLIVPWQRAGRVSPRSYLLAALAAAVAFVLVGLPVGRYPEPTMIQVFGSAAVAICAMILPGVSGAFLLKVLGLYESTLLAISTLDLVYIGVFALGAITGLALFARLLSYLLARHHSITMIVLVGLLAGALRALWPWQGQVVVADELVDTPAILEPPPDATAVLVALLIAAVGFALVGLLIWLGRRRDRLDAPTAGGPPAAPRPPRRRS